VHAKGLTRNVRNKEKREGREGYLGASGSTLGRNGRMGGKEWWGEEQQLHESQGPLRRKGDGAYLWRKEGYDLILNARKNKKRTNNQQLELQWLRGLRGEENDKVKRDKKMETWQKKGANNFRTRIGLRLFANRSVKKKKKKKGNLLVGEKCPQITPNNREGRNKREEDFTWAE